MDQNTVQAIYDQYPWAMESTLREILINFSDDNDVIVDELKRIQQELENAEDAVEGTVNVRKTIESGIKRTAESAGGILQTLERDIDPATATAELMGITANIAKAGGDFAGDLAKSFSRMSGNRLVRAAGAGTDGALKLIGSGGVALAAGATMFAKVMSDYDTNMRSMIEFGAVDRSIDAFSALEDEAAGLGISIQELHGIMSDKMYVFANLTGNTFSAQKDFVKLVDGLVNGPEAINRFGYNISEFSARIAEEAEALYRIGELDELNEEQTKRIIRSFEVSESFTLMLADATGQKRSEMLAERMEAKKDIDIQQAIRINRDKIIELYGEQGPQQIQEAFANASQMFQSYGPEVGKMLTETYKRYIMNLRVDQDFMNDFGAAASERLAYLGSEANSSIMSVMQSLVDHPKNGKADVLYENVRGSLEVLSRQPLPNVLGNANLANVYTDLVAANSTLMGLEGQTLEKQIEIMNSAGKFADGASTSIQDVDNVRIALRQTLRALTPSYSKVQKGMDFFRDTLANTVGVMGAILPDTVYDPKKAAEERFNEMSERQNLIRAQAKSYVDARDLKTAAEKREDWQAVAQYQEQMRGALMNPETGGYFTPEQLENEAKKTVTLSGDGESVVLTDPTAGTTTSTHVKSGISTHTTAEGATVRSRDLTKVDTNYNARSEHGSSSILNFIGKGEGTYESSNQGTVQSGTHNTIRDGKKLSELTIGEILNYQALPFGHPERLFAVGKYQFTKDPFLDAVKWGNYDKSMVFTPEVQDMIATDYFLMSRRPMLAAFLAGRKVDGREVTVEEALLDMSKEWASVPVPYTHTDNKGVIHYAGKSYYDGIGGNGASHTISDSKAELIKARDENLGIRNPQTPAMIDPKTAAGNNPQASIDTNEYMERNRQLDQEVNSKLASINRNLDGEHAAGLGVV